MIAFCKFALTRHGNVIVATTDQVGTLKLLRQYFPTELMELVNSGIKIHQAKQ